MHTPPQCQTAQMRRAACFCWHFLLRSQRKSWLCPSWCQHLNPETMNYMYKQQKKSSPNSLIFCFITFLATNLKHWNIETDRKGNPPTPPPQLPQQPPHTLNFFYVASKGLEICHLFSTVTSHWIGLNIVLVQKHGSLHTGDATLTIRHQPSKLS